MILPFPRTGPSSRCRLAVDDPNQIVELFASRKRNRTERFGLVHFAVADERPDFAPGRYRQAAVVQIAHEARLIDRHDRPQAHRDGRKLPKCRHQPRVRIRRQPFAVDFLAEMLQLLFADASFQKRARVNARRGMALEEDEIAAERFRLARGRSG